MQSLPKVKSGQVGQVGVGWNIVQRKSYLIIIALISHENSTKYEIGWNHYLLPKYHVCPYLTLFPYISPYLPSIQTYLPLFDHICH